MTNKFMNILVNFFFFKFIDQFFNNMQYERPVYDSLAMKLQFLRSEFSLVI